MKNDLPKGFFSGFFFFSFNIRVIEKRFLEELFVVPFFNMSNERINFSSVVLDTY